MEPKWLVYAKKLQSIAQAGLTYSKDPYDIDRFEQIRDLSFEIVSEHTNINKTIVHNFFANDTGYQTPKMDVRAVIFKEDRILMVREKLDNCWSLPGGWVDVDMSLSEAVKKEVLEEAGLNVEARRVLAILDYRKHHSHPMPYGIYKIFVECEAKVGRFIENIETSESDYFGLDHLPRLSLNRNTREQLEMCFRARDKACFEPIFD
jgi:ADP-ribose pyrophosphatase YjhB (NUDIX family)